MGVVAPVFCRFVVGLVFLTAGRQKLARPVRFEQALANYRLVPIDHLRFAARGLIGLELATGVGLTLGALTPVASVAGAALLLTFAGAISVNLLRGRRIDCGCFDSAMKISWPIVARNLLLAAMAAVAVFARPVLAVDELWSSGQALRTSDALGLVIAAVLLVLAAEVVTAFNEISVSRVAGKEVG